MGSNFWTARCVAELRRGLGLLLPITAQVRAELLKLGQVQTYVEGLVQVYGIVARVHASVTGHQLPAELQRQLSEADETWSALWPALQPFAVATVSIEDYCEVACKTADKQDTCGVCLLAVSTLQGRCQPMEVYGKKYHAPCANFWRHRIEPNGMLPIAS